MITLSKWNNMCSSPLCSDFKNENRHQWTMQSFMVSVEMPNCDAFNLVDVVEISDISRNLLKLLYRPNFRLLVKKYEWNADENMAPYFLMNVLIYYVKLSNKKQKKILHTDVVVLMHVTIRCYKWIFVRRTYLFLVNQIYLTDYPDNLRKI